MHDLAAIKARLADRAQQLVIALLGEPTAKGTRYWRWGRHGSLAYDFDNHRWHSFETEEGGDLLDLIRYGNPGWDLGRALAWARDWTGGRTAAIPTRPRRRALSPEAARTALALRLWHEATLPTRTMVETYLAGRGLRLPGGSDLALRFHPACPHGGAQLPAMLGLMRGIVTDRPLGVHRTFLSADGSAKSIVEPARMMLGQARGAVVKLTPDADVTLGLALTECIEDALAVLNSGVAPVWACLSPGAMTAFPVLRGVEALTIYRDEGAPGGDAADACARRWQSAGREVYIVDPPPYRKDFGIGATSGLRASG